MLGLLALLAGGVAAYALVRSVGQHESDGPATLAQALPAAMTAAPDVVAREKATQHPVPKGTVKPAPVVAARAAQPSAPRAAAPKPAAPSQGGKRMSKLQRITELQAAIQADGSTGKVKTQTEQAEMQQLAREVAAELKQPVYPLGMEATFGGKWVKILNAWQTSAGGPWSYQINAKLGMLFGLGDGQHTVTEADIQKRLTDALGALGPGQAYPRGITVMRGRKGGLVQAAAQDPKTGEWFYTLAGWGAPVPQSELTAILRAA